MHLSLCDVMQYTLRQLIVSYEACVIDKWDHTTQLYVPAHNIIQLVAILGSKKRPKMKSFYDMHPYRVDQRSQITPETIYVLKALV